MNMARVEARGLSRLDSHGGPQPERAIKDQALA
jgi:hypothetical protein